MGEPSAQTPAKEWAQLMHPTDPPDIPEDPTPPGHNAGDSGGSEFVPNVAKVSLLAVAASLQKSVTGMSRWSLNDLTLGLYKLAGRHALEGAADTINGCSVTSLKQLQEIFHWLDCARAAYEKDLQTLANHLKVEEQKIIKHSPNSEVLRPAFYIAVDDARQCVVMGIRGTLAATDILTNMNPHSEAFGEGFAHSGMLAAARNLMDSEASTLQDTLKANEGYKLVIVGHSLGAGTASLLCMLFSGLLKGGTCRISALGIPSSKIVCWGYGCPPCLDKGLAERAIFINNVVLQHKSQDDIIARVCPAALEDLRSEILATNWSHALQNGSKIKQMVDLVQSTHAALKQVEPALGLERGYLCGQATRYGSAAWAAAKSGVFASLQKAKRGEHGVNAQKAVSWFSLGAAATESVFSILNQGLKVGDKPPELLLTAENEEAKREILETRRLVVPGILYHIIKRPLKHEEKIISHQVSINKNLEAPPVSEAEIQSGSLITPDNLIGSEEKSLDSESAKEMLKSPKDGKGESSKTDLELSERFIVVRGDDPSSRFKRIVLSSSIISDHSLLCYQDALQNSIHWAAYDVSDL